MRAVCFMCVYVCDVGKGEAECEFFVDWMCGSRRGENVCVCV